MRVRERGTGQSGTKTKEKERFPRLQPTAPETKNKGLRDKRWNVRRLPGTQANVVAFRYIAEQLESYFAGEKKKAAYIYHT